MAERLERQLGPDAKQSLVEASRLAGRPPILKQVRDLPSGANAMLKRRRTPADAYQIHVKKREMVFLDHLVTHEVGHLIRLHQVPEDERYYAASTVENRRHAVEQLAPDLARLMTYGASETAVGKVFEGWYGGVCSQLVSFPADLRIEQWIHDRFPGLRLLQKRSLLREVGRSIPLFLPEVQALTPTSVYHATMSMNAAQAAQVADLYGLPSHLHEPFRRHGFAATGQRLLGNVIDQPDQGHRSDVLATNRWATTLHLHGWLQWLSPSERCEGVEVTTM